MTANLCGSDMLATRSYTRLFSLGLALLIASTLGLAKQVGEATLTVAVIDSNGAILPSAKITLQDSEDFQQTILTNQSGEAVFAKLPSGKYRLRVEAGHFEPHEREINVKLGSQRITIRLEIARIKEEVVVSQSEREKRTDPRSDTFTTVLT